MKNILTVSLTTICLAFLSSCWTTKETETAGTTKETAAKPAEPALLLQLHDWKDIFGHVDKGKFVRADGVYLTISLDEATRLRIPWDKVHPESQKLAAKLRKLAEESKKK